MKITFSIILPIYKQADQLQNLIQTYAVHLKKLHKPFEVILVINGGDTNSLELAKKLAQKNIFLRVIFVQEAGWGLAILGGIKQAKGKYICYTNSARTRITDLIQILKLAERNPDVVIKATRIMHLNWLRKLGSTLYNIECRMLLHTPVWDVNGTPKVLPSIIAKQLKLSSKGDLIDAELIAKCIWHHIPILEVPILFPERYGGKSTTKIISAIKMYLGLFFIRHMLRRSFLKTKLPQNNKTPKRKRDGRYP